MRPAPAPLLALLGAARGAVLWSYDVRTDSMGVGVASPLTAADFNGDGIADGVYFTTSSCIYRESDGTCLNSTGELVRLDAATGAQRWAFRPPASGVGVGRPQPTAAADGVAPVVVAAGRAGKPGSFDYSLAAVPLGATLRPAWRSGRSVGWATRPAAAAGRVVAAQCAANNCGGLSCVPGDCSVAAYDNVTGAQAWSVAVDDGCGDGQWDFAPPPAAGGGAAYAVACTSEGGGAAGGAALSALSLRDGALRWARALGAGPGAGEPPPRPVFADVAGVAGGAVFAASLRYQTGPGGDIEAVATVQAHRAADGAPLWSTPTSGWACSSFRKAGAPAAAVADGVAVLWDNFTLRAVDARTGAPRWDTRALGVTVVGEEVSPTVAGGAVLFSAVDGGQHGCDAAEMGGFRVHRVRLADGKPLGSAAAPPGVLAGDASPPVAAGGAWLFGATTEGRSMHSTIYALAAPQA